MEKGSAQIFVVLLIILGIILITPLPSYSSGYCIELVGVKCQGGWYFGDPLWRRIYQSLVERKNQVSLPTISSPKKELPIYKNTELRFEFKYDKDLTVKEDSEEEFNVRGNGDFRKNFKGYVLYEPGKFLGGVVVLDKDSSYEQNPFTLWVFDNPEELSIDNWYKNYWYYPFVWGDFTDKGKVELAPKMEATISGQLAKSGIIDYQPGKPKFVYISKDKKMYLFRIIGEGGDKILSTFKFLSTNQTSENKNGCKIGGCSSQLCAEEDGEGIVSTCIWQEEFACYKDAKCERQQNGQCGWTQTEKLTQCLEEKRNNNSEVVF